MQCPFCGKNNDKVVDSRSSEGGRAIRRRRECLVCERRFTTYEKPEEGIKLTVIKKDGSRVPYDRQKVIDGLERACYKRQITSEQIRSMLETVEDHLYRRFEKEVPSRVIGDLVSDCLRNIDKVAYMRFASVYRNFVDVGELIEEATEVKDAPVVGPEQKELFGDDGA
ncbi:MAG: transcriptional regulator NrdR [Planctomycetaceae bacterium]|nr:transcriptional regulator NrdR [Planctomycetaceae bacterium]